MIRHPRRLPSRLGGLGLLVVLSVVVPVGSNASVAPPGAATTRAAAPAGPLAEGQFARRLSKEVYAYLPYWQLNAETEAYLQYDLLTDIALFSVGLTSTGSIDTGATGFTTVTGSRAAAIVSKAHAAGVRVDLTLTSFGLEKNAAFFTNPTAQATAITALTGLVNQMGLDGVNVDVELLSGTYFPAYGAFVGQLRAALRAANPAARVSVATNGNTSGANMAVAALANGADRVFIMGYSYRTNGSSPAGSVAPIVRTDAGLSLSWTADTYAAKGVPANRIVLGLPYFGITWPTTSGALNATTTGSGSTFLPGRDLAGVPAGTVFNYDTTEQTAWFAIQNPTTKAWSQTYFDTERSLRAKYAFAGGRGYAGVGIWTLGYDRGAPGYWQAIASSFGAIRLAGSDRYATAAAVASHVAQPGVDTVYVATGLNFPDALAAVAVAGRSGSPILLVGTTAVPAATAGELSRLRPRRIVVVGSGGVVSDGVLNALRAYAVEGVSRIGGKDRYATAALVSGAAFPAGAPVAYLVSGRDFPDAVAGGPAAARDGGPILLTDPASLSPATAAELARLAPARVVIVGGPSAVSSAAEAAVRGLLPRATVERRAGADRYATSAAVSATFAAGAPAVFVATGLNFPDALAGGAAAGALGVPIVLTAPNALPSGVTAELTRLAPRRVVVLGGTSVVSEAVLAATRQIISAP